MTDHPVAIGVVQRTYPLHIKTLEALHQIPSNTIIIDSTPEKPIVNQDDKITVIHTPDKNGFFAISLLVPLFTEFLKTKSEKLFLIEGDLVLSIENISRAEQCTVNTKVFYAESDPESRHAYIRREGLAGVLLRSECEKILHWMLSKPPSIFRKYQGYCDTFLWYAVSSETTGYSASTSGPDWIPVVHMTHDDYTRVTKIQRRDMKVYRACIAEVINLAMECNQFTYQKSS